jgi:hypothetical protein
MLSLDIGLDEKAIEQSNKFSWERTVGGTLKVYDELLIVI